MVDDFIKLQNNYRFGGGAAIIGGIRYINDIAVTIVVMRGSTIEERMKWKPGYPAPEGYRKALRLIFIYFYA